MKARHVLTIFLLIVSVLSIELLILLYLFPSGGAGKRHPPEKTKGTSSKVQDILPDTASDRQELEAAILHILGEDAAQFSIYLLRPQKERLPFLYQAQRPMRPASMIKVFILAKAMEDVRDGKRSLDETIVLRWKDMVDGAGVLDGEPVGT